MAALNEMVLRFNGTGSVQGGLQAAMDGAGQAGIHRDNYRDDGRNFALTPTVR
jgi:hypothetical protein